MRHLYVVIDMSQAMESQDLKPTRLLSALKVCAWIIWVFSYSVDVAKLCYSVYQ